MQSVCEHWNEMELELFTFTSLVAQKPSKPEFRRRYLQEVKTVKVCSTNVNKECILASRKSLFTFEAGCYLNINTGVSQVRTIAVVVLPTINWRIRE